MPKTEHNAISFDQSGGVTASEIRIGEARLDRRPWWKSTAAVIGWVISALAGLSGIVTFLVIQFGG